jgi:hypothetical protein
MGDRSSEAVSRKTDMTAVHRPALPRVKGRIGIGRFEIKANPPLLLDVGLGWEFR